MSDYESRRRNAKPVLRRFLLERARDDNPIFYLPLTLAVPELEMKYPGRFLYGLLDEISIEEVERGGPMISAMAVHSRPHKKGNNRIEPGERFYELAQQLHRLPADASPEKKYKFWLDERRVVVKWARKQSE